MWNRTIVKNTHQTKILLLLMIGLSMTGCRKLICGLDDQLNLDKKMLNQDALKLDGYYFKDEGNDIFTVYFLYQSGIIRYMGSSTDIEKVLNSTSSSQTSWGIVEVDSDNIAFEKWYPTSGCSAPAFVREGEILNDSTFHISRSFRIQNGEETEVREKDETYHFVKFSPKPDSTNAFIK